MLYQLLETLGIDIVDVGLEELEAWADGNPGKANQPKFDPTPQLELPYIRFM